MTSFVSRGGWWVVGQVALFALYGAALLGTDVLDVGTGAAAIRVVGVVMVVAAILIGVWSLRLLGSDLTPYPAPQEDSSLQEHGPYRIVRHPIYLAVVLGTVGLAVALLNPAATLVGLSFVPYFAAKSGHEERMLAKRFAGYADYRSRVRYRLIPGIF
jgi:protein-S-isoprenylcysteine O-methyltransferase Ste14